MQTALIPPRGFEYTVLDSTTHLVLPFDECRNNPAYVETYQHAADRGDYIILDNGCAEGRLVDGGALLDFAWVIDADEIVAPDVMGDGPGTVEATLAWLKEFGASTSDMNVMGVLQGAEGEWRNTLHAFANEERITTVGVPKVHVTHGEDRDRLHIVKYINRYYPDRFKIHLLGLSSWWPTEVRDTAWPAEVRSMDSAQPYKLAEKGYELTPLRPWAKRRPDYFAVDSGASPDLVHQNIKTFMEWGQGK